MVRLREGAPQVASRVRGRQRSEHAADSRGPRVQEVRRPEREAPSLCPLLFSELLLCARAAGSRGPISKQVVSGQ